MAGYTRNDTSNNIANGNVIDADDLDGEFNAIESAFNESTGHTHDGTSAEGAAIEVTGPNQEYLSDAVALYPKTDDTYDLGKTGAEWKDLYINGTANIDSLVADTVDVNGGTIDGTIIGGTTPAAISGTTGTFTGNVTVSGTVDGRDVSADGTKLDTIETNADVTDTANVTAAGALMDSELTDIAAVKGLDQGVATTDSPDFAALNVNGDALINGITVGRGAGNVSTCTVLGQNALDSNTTGASHTAIGINALRANTTGGSNTSVGFNSLFSNTTGSFNTAVGRDTLNANVTGGSNSAFGNGALQNNTANSNTAVGVNAASANTTGLSNVALGVNTLLGNTTGSNNTALGANAINNVTIGVGNTALGSGSGTTLTTGNRNIIVGVSSQPSAVAGSDQVVVGYDITGKGNDTAFIGGTNGAYNEKNVTTWETTSDERIKKNIMDNNDGLAVLSKIQVRNFEYRTPDEIADLPSHAAIEQEGVQLGVIAQELQQVLPECVSENSTGVLSVNTDPLIWYLINAVKELKAEITQLKGE